MPRAPRQDYPGAWHHVMNRGARRAPIFKTDEHCLLFLDCLHDMVVRYGLEVHAYSLMPNHYHLLVRCPSDVAILSRSIRFLNGNYAKQINRKHGWDGPLFKGRFRSQLVSHDRYLIYLFSYIHMNPVRGHLVSRADEECWTSFRAYLGLEKCPDWLTVDTLLDQLGEGPFLKDFVDALHRKSEPWPDVMDLRTGMIHWKEALQSIDKRGNKPPRRCGLDKRKVAGLLNRACEISGAKRSDLKRKVCGPNANPARRFALWVLAETTTMTQKEMGAYVNMSASQVAKTLARLKGNLRPPLDQWAEEWEANTNTNTNT